MNFQSLNSLNTFMNKFSGNFLPVTNDERNGRELSVLLKIYLVIVWLTQLAYLTACIFGFFHVPREKLLKDGTINMLVSVESIILTIYLSNRTSLLRELIGKLNYVLIVEDEVLRRVVISTIRPFERPLRIYTIASISSVVIWTSLPFFEVFRRNEFYYTDYRVPAVLSEEPFTVGIFIAGIFLQMLGSAYTITRKISLDLYTMHLLLLVTAQYKYLRIKFAAIFHQQYSTNSNDTIKRELKLLTRHYQIVIQLTTMLKKLLSPNIGILYVDNVFRFCFIGFMMLVTISTLSFEKYLIILYMIGALTQFYVLCFCIQELFEASRCIADDVVYEAWYMYDMPLQRVTAMIVLGNKLECKLSTFRNIDLTLPSFMSILNQAYSVCLFFLKARPT